MKDYSFDHVHVCRPDPFATAHWFADNFGAVVIDPWTDPNGVAHVILDLKGVNIFVKGRAQSPTAKSNARSTYGLEHISITTGNVEGTVADLKANGNTFAEEISATLLSGVRHAFLNGPDDVLIELIERKTA